MHALNYLGCFLSFPLQPHTWCLYGTSADARENHDSSHVGSEIPEMRNSTTSNPVTSSLEEMEDEESKSSSMFHNMLRVVSQVAFLIQSSGLIKMGMA